MQDEEQIPVWIHGRLQPVGKLEAHRRGLRHLAVSVFVLRGEALLLQRRAMGKYHTPGLWANTCCTHPRWEETDEACAIRRLGQEMGITGLPVTWRGQVEYRAEVGGGMVEHEVVDLFTAEAPEGVEAAPNPDEVMEVRWVDLAQLRAEIAAEPDLFVPWLRIYLDRHGELLFGPPPVRPGRAGD